jgi:hypothetical protein
VPRSTLQARNRRLIVGGSAALLLPFPAVLGACGGAGGGAISSSAAQQQLVAVADRLDACYAQRGDARKCTDDQIVGGDGAQLGEGPGEVQVAATRPTRYQLTMKVDDRTRFAILVQPVGARKRVCSPAGAGGCPKDGVW